MQRPKEFKKLEVLLEYKSAKDFPKVIAFADKPIINFLT